MEVVITYPSGDKERFDSKYCNILVKIENGEKVIDKMYKDNNNKSHRIIRSLKDGN